MDGAGGHRSAPVVYTMHGPRPGIILCRRCPRDDCRAVHAPNMARKPGDSDRIYVSHVRAQQYFLSTNATAVDTELLEDWEDELRIYAMSVQAKAKLYTDSAGVAGMPLPLQRLRLRPPAMSNSIGASLRLHTYDSHASGGMN
eukprot:TRINITY_DN8082_c0_g1_i1.p1 TRINITY_DN8082_c0_g1~~TRINITY_DN8082_c0_g1_i1.p1  ORF type:complete len:143 (-),score=26.33 TRINITY_DN8082_c0_g1_i1:4-432(-)